MQSISTTIRTTSNLGYAACFVAAFLIVSLISGCGSREKQDDYNSPNETRPKEPVVTPILLDNQIEWTKEEISGLAWFGAKEQYLAILPQCDPSRTKGRKQSFYLYYLDREKIEQNVRDAISGENTQPKNRLSPKKIPIIDNGILAHMKGFEGFEAIVFDQNEVSILIECEKPMRGFCLTARLETTIDGVPLKVSILSSSKLLRPQTNATPNLAFEAMTRTKDNLLVLFEANGALRGYRSEKPNVQLLSKNGAMSSTPLQELEYRITDATKVIGNRFWVTNYQFAGDSVLRTSKDKIASLHKRGATHQKSFEQGEEKMIVERLLELEITNTGVAMSKSAPIQLQLEKPVGSLARNWEGIVRMTSPPGFLIAADEYSTKESILGFVPAAK